MALPVKVERGLRLDPLDIVRNDLDILGRFLGFGQSGDRGNGLPSVTSLGVDIREDADHFYVDADLPGFRKDDVDISLEDGMLTITAERREEVTEPPPAGQQTQRASSQQASPPQGSSQQGTPSQQSASSQEGAGQDQRRDGRSGQGASSRHEQNYLLRERRVERFVRSFTLPPNVDESSVQARLENGVLHVVLNKKEESKPKRIQVS